MLTVGVLIDDVEMTGALLELVTLVSALVLSRIGSIHSLGLGFH